MFTNVDSDFFIVIFQWFNFPRFTKCLQNLQKTAAGQVTVVDKKGFVNFLARNGGKGQNLWLYRKF